MLALEQHNTKGPDMESSSQFSVVIYADAKYWAPHTEAEFVTDWLEPICSHPRVKYVNLLGALGRITRTQFGPRLNILSSHDERAVVLGECTKPDIAGVLRLRHSSKLRFPINH